MNLEDLTPEQQRELEKQTEKRLLEKKQKKNRDREDLKQMKSDLVDEFHPLSNKMLENQEEFFRTILIKSKELIKMEKMIEGEEYEDIESDKLNGQFSYTFTNPKTGNSIILGRNINIRWDSNVENGIAKINRYIDNHSSNEEVKPLAGLLRAFLSKEKKGNLDPNNVRELKKEVIKIADAELINAVDIIEASMIRTAGRMFLKTTKRNDDGKKEDTGFRLTK